MSQEQLSQFPGLAEKRARERGIREAAWLSHLPFLIRAEDLLSMRMDNTETPALVTLELGPFTLQKFLERIQIGCPFISGSREPEPGDIANFLWHCSPRYSRAAKSRKMRLYETLTRLRRSDLEAGIEEYLNRAFLDAPNSSKNKELKKEELSASTFVSVLMDLFAREYGWTPAQILALPLAAIWHQRREILARLHPEKAVLGMDPAVIKADGERLRALNAANKAKAEAEEKAAEEKTSQTVPENFADFVATIPVTIVTQNGQREAE